jgi:peptide deformylase
MGGGNMNLVPHTHPALNAPAAPVPDIRMFERDYERMLKLMRERNSAGIAGPQVGIPFRFFVSKYDNFAVCVNPAWEPVGNERTSKPEATLSKPHYNRYVSRFDQIEAVWTDAKGVQCGRELSGMEARVFQHLCDYLDGKFIWIAT